jgi:hypothetical protein
MRKGAKVSFLIFGSLLLVIPLARIALRSTQPTYKGRSFDYWAERFAYEETHAGKAEDGQAAAAVRALRTIPEMLQDMDYDGTARRNRRFAILRKLPRPLAGLLFDRVLADYRQSREVAAVSILAKPDIEPAAVIPGLEQLVRSTNGVITWSASYVLLSKGTNGLAAFFKAVREPGQGDPLRLLDYLGKIHRHGLWTAATPELMRLSKEGDPDIARAARRTLDKIHAEREAALARVLSPLTNTDATFRLIAVSHLLDNERAQPQVRAALSNALHDPDPDIRAAAARAITNPVPGTSTNLWPD